MNKHEGKGKRIVLAVILGVSLVMLALALVSGLTDSLVGLIDNKRVESMIYYVTYRYTIAGMELGMVCLGIAFAAVLLCAKAKHSKACSIAATVLLAVLVAYFIGTAIALRVDCLKYDGYRYYIKEGVLFEAVVSTIYAMFLAYVTSMLTVCVTSVLAFVSAALMNKRKKEELPETSETTPDERKV